MKMTQTIQTKQITHNNLPIPRVYLVIYGRLKNKILQGNICDVNELKEVIRMTAKMTEKERKLCIEDLILFRLLKRISRDRFELLNLRIKEKPCDFSGNPLWLF